MAGEAEKAPAAAMMAVQTNETSLSLSVGLSLSPPPSPALVLHLLPLFSFLPVNVKSTRGPSVGFIFFSPNLLNLHEERNRPSDSAER